MAQIGQFTRTASGFDGHLRSLGLDEQLVLVPVEESDAENAPAYRIHLDGEDGSEVGAAWKHTSERAGEFLSLELDGPVFPQPIRARLFQSGEDATSWGLHWKRPSKRGERE